LPHPAAPVATFVVSAVSLYLGAAIAVRLFDHVEPGGVAWLRSLFAAAILLGIARPWRHSWTRSDLGWTAAFGTVLVSMNACFYVAADTLPLGTAVAIEFIGPVAFAAAATRTARNGAAVALAGLGVVLLAGVQLEGSSRGVAFALAAAVLWAGYIALGHRVADRTTGLTGLAVAIAAGTLVTSPVLAPLATDVVDDAGWLAAAVAVGVLSSVIPYALDQWVLRRVSADRFAVLLAILPATATLIGLASLGQVPSGPDLVGIALVTLGVGLRETATRGPRADAIPPAP
jgi:inner membrane transporter RhtA